MSEGNYIREINSGMQDMLGGALAKDRFARHLNLEDGKLIETVDGEQHTKTMRVYADGSVGLGCTKISAAAMKHIIAKYTLSA